MEARPVIRKYEVNVGFIDVIVEQNVFDDFRINMTVITGHENIYGVVQAFFLQTIEKVADPLIDVTKCVEAALVIGSVPV